MLKFESFHLDNGLQVVVHEDPHSLVATVNIMYKVGSRDEDPHRTGFAHLFEHLMFGGSQHISSYDGALQQVGGNNNAYTTSDVTSYHCTLPVVNLETAFWLESDRMLSLSFNKKVLDVQKKVVIEEFKEVYLNQPYGDAWLLLSELAYTTHPYRWAVIGKEIGHIEQATLQDVKDFFKKFYTPNNAVLVIAGAVNLAQVKELSKKWFGPISSGPTLTKKFSKEPIQKNARHHTISSSLPLEAIYKAYHIPGRLEKDYYVVELLCIILGIGKSSRLYEELIEKNAYFNTIHSYTTETIDPGLLIITGRINEESSLALAETALLDCLRNIKDGGLDQLELEKVQNHMESTLVYESVDIAHRAEELALATVLGDTNLANTLSSSFAAVTLEDMNRVARDILTEENCSTLYYKCK